MNKIEEMLFSRADKVTREYHDKGIMDGAIIILFLLLGITILFAIGFIVYIFLKSLIG